MSARWPRYGRASSTPFARISPRAGPGSCGKNASRLLRLTYFTTRAGAAEDGIRELSSYPLLSGRRLCLLRERVANRWRCAMMMRACGSLLSVRELVLSARAKNARSRKAAISKFSRARPSCLVTPRCTGWGVAVALADWRDAGHNARIILL